MGPRARFFKGLAGHAAIATSPFGAAEGAVLLIGSPFSNAHVIVALREVIKRRGNGAEGPQTRCVSRGLAPDYAPQFAERLEAIRGRFIAVFAIALFCQWVMLQHQF